MIQKILLATLIPLGIIASSDTAAAFQHGEIRYPSQILEDPSPVSGSDGYGVWIGTSEDWLVFSEPIYNPSPLPKSQLHFFRRGTTEFEHAQTQAAAPVATNPFPGYPDQLSLRGNTAILTDRGHFFPGGGSTDRQVFIFEFDGVTWTHTQVLESFPASYGVANPGFFGHNHCIVGDDTIAVTGQLQVGPMRTEAVIYIFERGPSGWVGTQVLHEPPPNFNMGWAADGLKADETQIVGSDYRGAFRVIEKNEQGLWEPAGGALSPNQYAASFQTAAAAIAIEGDLVAMGMPMEHMIGFPTMPHVGVVQVFRRIAGVWTWEAELSASDGVLNYQAAFQTYYNDQFGISVDIDQGRILVGAYQALTLPGGYPQGNVHGSLGQGQAYVFEHVNGSWQETYRLRRADTGQWDKLGWAVQLQGSTAVVSAPGATSNGVARSGAVHVFNLPMGHTACQGLVNSTGESATLDAVGWADIALGDLSLEVNSLPPGQTTLFLAARQVGFVQPAGSQGVFCLGGAFARFNRAGEFGPADSSGRREFTVPTTDIPINPSTPMLSGETWVFQCWYRDQNPMATSNFSEAIEVHFE